MHQRQELRLLLVGERLPRTQQVAARALDAPDLRQAAGVADRDGIGGPGGGEVHPRSDLEHEAGCIQKTRPTEALRLEGLAEQPGERPELGVAQLAGGVDVEAVLGLEVLDVGCDTLPGELQKRVSLGGGQPGRAEQVQQAHAYF